MNLQDIEESILKTRCDRCSLPTGITIMSMFNKDTLCLGCKELERQHPDYQKAVEADCAAISRGNYNFDGIGRPSDL